MSNRTDLSRYGIGLRLIGVLVLAFLASATSARSESPEASSGRSPWAAKVEGASDGKGVRPPDDSDPEMQRLWVEILRSPNCRDYSMRCEPRQRLFRFGGDRLAGYLIRQFEESLAGGYPGAGHYLLYVATTGSERGIRYVLDEFENPKRENGRSAALAGLLDAGDPRAIDLAVRLLNDPTVTGRASEVAMNVLRRNAEATETISSEGVQVLRRLESEQNTEKPWLRKDAFRALNGLERRGIVAPRVPPADLLQEMPTKPE